MDEFGDGVEIGVSGDLLTISGSEAGIFDFVRKTDAPGSSTFFGFSDGSGFGILDSLTKLGQAGLNVLPQILRDSRPQRQQQLFGMNSNTLLLIAIGVVAFIALRK